MYTNKISSMELYSGVVCIDLYIKMLEMRID